MIITETINGVTIEREANTEETKYFTERQLELQKIKDAEELDLKKIQDAKASAMSKLAALGLSADEVAALIG